MIRLRTKRTSFSQKEEFVSSLLRTENGKFKTDEVPTTDEDMRLNSDDSEVHNNSNLRTRKVHNNGLKLHPLSH